jgi:hypothetical protein
MEKTTRLTFPERQPQGTQRMETRPRAVRAWLAGLPVADSAETGRTVYQALSQSNRRPIRPGRRLAYLRELHRTIDHCVEGLRTRYRQRELPLRGEPRKTATLVTRLLQEMALGYEIALEDLREKGIRPARTTPALIAALHYRSRVLVENWVIYETPPPGTWKRLHQLYQIAVDKGLTSRRVRADWSDHERRASPASTYKRICLAAATSPLQLDRGEILDVWMLLAHWASSAEISALSNDGDEVFRIPRRDDRPPHAGIGGLNREDDRYLITTPLIRRVRRELRRHRSRLPSLRRSSAAADYPELTQRLLIALAAVPSRQHRRIRVQSRIQSVLGLSRAHEALSEERGLAVPGNDTRERAFQSRDRNQSAKERDVWDMIQPSAIDPEVERRLRGTNRDTTQTTQSGKQSSSVEQWKLVNISPRGYCLLANPEETYRARVGEILLLREVANQRRSWQVGVVRWLRGLGGKNLQVGVQILGKDPHPVMVRHRLQNGRYGPQERGFVLPGANGNDGIATLIAPGPHYQAGQQVSLRYGQAHSQITLGYRREASNHFAQTEFEFADPMAVDRGLSELLSENPVNTAS